MSYTVYTPFPENEVQPLSERAPKRIERLRGLRSFLTWSFFLAQIPAMEAFAGASADAAQANDPQDDPPPPAMEAAKAVQAFPASAVQSAADALPGAAAQSAPGAVAPAAARAGEDAPPLAEPTVMPADSEAGMPVSSGGGGSVSGGEASSVLPLGADSLLSEMGLVPGNAIQLDVTDITPLLADGIDTALDLIDGALAGLGAAPMLENLADGLASTLFGDGQPGAERLLSIANSGGEGEAAALQISASGPVVSDFVLALSVDPPTLAPVLDAPASLLHALPLFGDVLPAPRPIGEADHAADLPDLAAGVSQIADHVGLVKGAGDLWS